MGRGGWGMGGVAPGEFVRAARLGLIIRLLDILSNASIIQYMDAATRRAAHITQSPRQYKGVNHGSY